MNVYWQKVNRDMVAKILAELEYERTLSARQLADNRWQITMGAETWQFQATRGIWGWLHIDPESLTTVSGNAVAAACDGTGDERRADRGASGRSLCHAAG